MLSIGMSVLLLAFSKKPPVLKHSLTELLASVYTLSLVLLEFNM